MFCQCLVRPGYGFHLKNKRYPMWKLGYTTKEDRTRISEAVRRNREGNPLNTYMFRGENRRACRPGSRVDWENFTWYYSPDNWDHFCKETPFLDLLEHKGKPVRPMEFWRILNTSDWEDIDDGKEWPVRITEESEEWIQYMKDTAPPPPDAWPCFMLFKEKEFDHLSKQNNNKDVLADAGLKDPKEDEESPPNSPDIDGLPLVDQPDKDQDIFKHYFDETIGFWTIPKYMHIKGLGIFRLPTKYSPNFPIHLQTPEGRKKLIDIAKTPRPMGAKLQPNWAEIAGRVQVAELTNGMAKDFECFLVNDPDRMSYKRKGLCASIAEEELNRDIFSPIQSTQNKEENPDEFDYYHHNMWYPKERKYQEELFYLLERHACPSEIRGAGYSLDEWKDYFMGRKMQFCNLDTPNPDIPTTPIIARCPPRLTDTEGNIVDRPGNGQRAGELFELLEDDADMCDLNGCGYGDQSIFDLLSGRSILFCSHGYQREPHPPQDRRPPGPFSLHPKGPDNQAGGTGRNQEIGQADTYSDRDNGRISPVSIGSDWQGSDYCDTDFFPSSDEEYDS